VETAVCPKLESIANQLAIIESMGCSILFFTHCQPGFVRVSPYEAARDAQAYLSLCHKLGWVYQNYYLGAAAIKAQRSFF